MMNNNNSKGVSYTAGFFILIGLAITLTAVSAMIALGMVHGDIAALSDPGRAGLLRAIQAISVLIGMLLPALVTAQILNRRPLHLLGFREVQPAQLGIVIAIVIASLPVAGALGYLNKMIPISAEMKTWFDSLEKSYTDQVLIMMDVHSTQGFIVSLLLMALLPAICEETLFRGGLQNFLSRATGRPWLAILIVSILFSLAHFSYYGFLVRLFLGIVLGVVYERTRNIWLSATVHFLNNALAVAQFYWLVHQGKDIKAALNDDVSFSYWGLLGIPVLIVLFRLLKKRIDPETLQQTR